MMVTGGRLAALSIGIPLALGVVGWQAFNMVGFMAQTSEHFEESYAWHGGEIAVDVSSGSVRVVAGDSATVGVSYTEHYQLKKPTASVTPTGTGMLIKARCPGGVFSNNCSINYVLTVPSSAQMAIRTGDGGVRVSDLRGDLSLDTGSGGVSLANLSGDVQVKTGDGGVRGENLRSGVLEARTGNGGVNLTWSKQPGNVVVRTGDGGVRITVPNGTGPYHVDVSTGDGGKHVSVATDPAAKPTITAHTGNGGVVIGYP